MRAADHPAAGEDHTHPGPRRRLGLRVAAWMRWLHIYLSMFGLATVLFFGVTGLTLNHPTWFGASIEHRTEAAGRVESKWLAPGSAEGQVDKLAVVEFLRAKHGVRGALDEFRVDAAECMVMFKGPGYAADAFIDRETGEFELAQTSFGLVAVLNDLHKGRDTGPVWSWVIDISAVLMTLISLTGFVLIFYLKLRRRPGLVVGLVGAVVLGLIAWFWVPG